MASVRLVEPQPESVSPDRSGRGTEAPSWPAHRILGAPICPLTMDEVLSAVDEVIRRRQRLLIGVVNAGKLVNMRRDARLREAVLGAHMILADGMSVVWASRVLRRPLPERVAGIDLMSEMLRQGSGRGYRVYCLGATEEVLEATVARIRKDYPGIVIAGSHHGYFKEHEDEAIANEIRACRPDVLFAAMSSPKKEVFLGRWWPRLNVPVCHGVGGAFDVVAGKVLRAPDRWQRWGLEWLYRVLQEPGRLWKRYLVTNTLFCGMVASSLAEGLRTRGRPAEQRGNRVSRRHDGNEATRQRSSKARGNGRQERAAGAFQTEVISSPEGFDALAPEWNELLEQSSARSVFLTWEWIRSWLDTIGRGARLRVITVRDAAGRLSAVGPFYQARLMLLRAAPYRCLRILGDAVGGAEYGDVIVRQDVEQHARRMLFEALARRRNVWDAIWLANMGPTGDAAGALYRAADRSGFLHRSRECEFSRIPLPGTFDEYLAGLPGKIRYQFRRGVERLETQFHGRLTPCADEGDLDGALDDLLRLHRARWSQRGESGVFTEDVMRDFYRVLGRRMLSAGWLRLDRACVEGHAVAAQMGFSYGGVFYELQRGFEPSFPNLPGGLGAALRSMVLRRCFSEGVGVYDFLGGYNTDKERAGAERNIGCDVLMVRPSMRNRVLFASGAWPTGRYLRFAGERACLR